MTRVRNALAGAAVMSALAMVTAPNTATALQTSGNTSTTIQYGSCRFRVHRTNGGASVAIINGGRFYPSGGSFYSHFDGQAEFVSSDPSYYGEISAGLIESCGFSNVTNLVQNGVDGTIAQDDYLGFTFSGTFNGVSQDFEYSMSGVSITTFVATPAPIDTTAPDQPTGTTVTVNDDGSVTVTGNAEEGATVDVTFPDGLTRSTVATGGTFTTTSAANQVSGSISIVVVDGADNASQPLVLTVVVGPTAQETQTEIATFMQSRANQIISAQPDLIGLLSGAATGAFNLQATQDNGSFDFTTSGNRHVWAQLQGTWSETDDAEGSYTFGVAGAHTSVGENTLLGVMLQFDQSEQTEGDAKTEGTGFLVGPYLVTKLPNHPLYFEGRLLAGKTANEVNVDGNTPEEFDTTRVLASAKVAGNLEFGALTLTPNLTATHLSETQDAFTDSADNTIAEQSITMTDIALGLDVAQVFALEGGALTLSGGVAAVMSSSDGSGFAEDVVSTFDGERGRVHLGARYALESGMILSAGTSFDGLGSDDFESTSVNVGLQMQF